MIGNLGNNPPKINTKKSGKNIIRGEVSLKISQVGGNIIKGPIFIFFYFLYLSFQSKPNHEISCFPEIAKYWDTQIILWHIETITECM